MAKNSSEEIQQYLLEKYKVSLFKFYGGHNSYITIMHEIVIQEAEKKHAQETTESY